MSSRCFSFRAALGVALIMLALVSGGGRAEAASAVGPNVLVTTADLIPTPCGASPCDQDEAASPPFDVLGQDEPSIAQSPNHPNLLAVGVNSYQTYALTGDGWQGLSVSIDGGATWPDALQSLIPGFPGDNTPEAASSPIFGNQATSDPVLSFDDQYLYFAFIAFNRTQIRPASDKQAINAVAVARYRVRTDGSGIDYDDTFIVRRGVNGFGQQEDKEWIKADRVSGDIYVAYARFNGFTDTLEFQKSSDHGETWSRPLRLDETTRGTQFVAITPAPGNHVLVAYRGFPPAIKGQTQGAPKQDAIYIVRSDDGGTSFTKPKLVSFIEPYDWNRTATPPQFRTSSEPSIATSANGNVWLTFDAKNNATSGDDVNVVCSADFGATWSARKHPHSLSAALGASGNGHQFMPSVTVANDTLSIIWYDSRSEPTFDPNGRVTSDNFTIGAGPGLDAFYNQLDASSCASDFAVPAGELRLTSQSFNPNVRASRQGTFGFIGDYIQVVADATNAYAVWTDNRDITDQSTCEDADPTTNDTTCINNRSRDANVYFQKIVK